MTAHFRIESRSLAYFPRLATALLMLANLPACVDGGEQTGSSEDGASDAGPGSTTTGLPPGGTGGGSDVGGGSTTVTSGTSGSTGTTGNAGTTGGVWDTGGDSSSDDGGGGVTSGSDTTGSATSEAGSDTSTETSDNETDATDGEELGTEGTTGGDDGDSTEEGETGTTDDDSDSSSEESEEESTETGDDMVCDDETPVRLYLSPDDSNSVSSPVQVRQRIFASGVSALWSVPIRPWEFFNYYNITYPAAAPDQLALTTELTAHANLEDRYTLQIAVSSETLTREARPNMNITLVLDTSGSMAGPPFNMLRATCHTILSQLREGDTISIVEWDTQNRFLLDGHHVSGPADAVVRATLDGLEIGGGTDLHGGLQSGYEVAERNFAADEINRVVLISDGQANAGITSIDLIASKAEDQNQDGIYLVGVGVGVENYNDQLMDQVTDAGKGASVFVANENDAQRSFGSEFLSTMAIAARNVQVALDLPPGFELVTFSGEDSSTDPSEVEPQHIAPNDHVVFHQEIETCAPELVDADAEVGVTLNWIDADTREPRTANQRYNFIELLGEASPAMLEGQALMAYIDALIARQQMLHGQVTSAEADARQTLAETRIQTALEVLPGDPDLVEMGLVLDRI